MNYSVIKPLDIADGPGCRVALFVSGCTHHCKGCFQPETWSFEYGQPFTQDTEDHIMELLEPTHVRGLTLLGGDPFEKSNYKALLPLVQRVKREMPEKDIWCYTGYDFEKDILSWLEKEKEEHSTWVSHFLECIDIIVDGEFIEELKSRHIQFRGSSNQKVIDVKESLAKSETVIWAKLEDRC